MNEGPGKSASPVAVKITGDFNFPLNAVFRDVMQRYPKGERDFEVDLAKVEELDSSALGMLLQLRDHSRDGVNVTLVNLSEPVRAAIADALVGPLFVIANK